MDRATCERKLQDMLDDTSVYEKLKRDPSQALECKMNSMLLDLNRKKELTQTHLLPCNCGVVIGPLLYGLPKIHKADVPCFLHSLSNIATVETSTGARLS